MSEKKKKCYALKTKLFLFILFCIANIALIIPLRPEFSDVEKRKLDSFPEFTIETFLDGSYFSAISSWYSDTFPFRDQLVSANTAVTSLEGVKANIIKGSVSKGDVIPEVAEKSEKKTRECIKKDNSDDEKTKSDITKDDIAYEEKTAIDKQIKEEKDKNNENSSESDQAKDENNKDENIENTTDEELSTQSMGAIFIAGNACYEYYGFSQATSDAYVDTINTLSSCLPDNTKVYDMIVPNSMDITLKDSIRQNLNSSDQNKAIKYMYSGLTEKVEPVKIFDTLRKHNDEYIYFRTDHHWTALGAYYAYSQFKKAKGEKARSIDSYQSVDYEGFLGTFYAQSGKMDALSQPDTVRAYIPDATNVMTFYGKDGNPVNWNIISDVTNWNTATKYSTFIGGDNPLAIIENPQKTDGSSILVIKESYGNALVPFLVDDYQYVYVIDYRSSNEKLTNFVNEKGINDVLFINTIIATNTQSRVDEMRNLIQ
ncbi:DHHW protein [Acetitomaculum ruminis DSM 5522]|uniref:DHHW protein n=1 Tax=Acetitomaculum ruminis DSM 5522 TaxID=1120918 RepID=A0A1I0Z7H6_9FIRM|nr:DHHW family protein [Acetitomaculum ruminis]SFB20398.1 DHHW protein [Acetitomaculum ruminis DSM 5522]